MGTPEQNAQEEAFLTECIEREKAEEVARTIWREKHIPSPEDCKQANDSLKKDLRASDPVVGAFMELADQVRLMANSVESIAWEMDRQRRGKLSSGARSDATEVGQTVMDLIKSPQMPQKDRVSLIEGLLSQLTDLRSQTVAP